MQNQFYLNCDICEAKENPDNIIRELGCQGRHLICSDCLLPVFSMKEHERQIKCPLDNELISLRGRNLFHFPEAKNKSEKEVNLCKNHGQKILTDWLCLKCSKKICITCKPDHETHGIVLTKDIIIKTEELANILREKTNKIDQEQKKREDFTKRIIIEKMKMIDNEIDLCKIHLDVMKDELKSKFKDFLSRSDTQENHQEITKIEQINTWNVQAKQRLADFTQKQKFDEEILCELAKIEESANKIGFNNCLSRIRDFNKAFEQKMTQISISFAQKFTDLVKADIFDNFTFSKSAQMPIVPKKKAPQPIQAAIVQKKENPQPYKGEKRGRSRSRGRALLEQLSDAEKARSSSRKKSKRSKSKPNYKNDRSREQSEEKKFEIKSRSRSMKRGFSSNREPRHKSIDSYKVIQEALKSVDVIVNQKDSKISLYTPKDKESYLNIDDALELLTAFRTIPDEHQKVITSVYFCCKGLKSKGVAALGEVLSGLCSLEQLTLIFRDSSGMEYNDFKHIEGCFKQFLKLENFILDLSKMTDIVENICSMKNIKTMKLDFSGPRPNQISDNGFIKVLECLDKLEEMQSLTIIINDSNLTDDCMRSIENLSNKDKLLSLSLCFKK